jgi:hypothetical protein
MIYAHTDLHTLYESSQLTVKCSRKRRVKCDEAKPACRRCTDSGVECSGYFSTAVLTAQSQSSKTGKLPLIPRVAERLAVTFPPSQLAGASDKDKRSFEFFRSETGPAMSGYFDADFWNHFLLQFSHHNPAIWHSVLALSAFHELRLLSDDRPIQKVDLAHQRYALLQYNQAISDLTGRLSTRKAPIEIVLVSCVIFITLESLVGNMPRAANHMVAGIQIARLWKKERAQPASSRLSPKFIESNIIPFFDQMNRFNFAPGRAAPPISEFELALDEPESEWFASIPEARASLLRLTNRAQHFTINFGSRDEELDITKKHAEVFQKHRLLFQIQRWEAALDELLTRPKTAHISARDRGAVALLRLQHNIVWIVVSNTKNANETSFDAFVTKFEAVVDLAQSIFDTELGTSGTSWTQRWARSVVHFQTQNVPHLYLTATKCRNPTIRRKALALLKSSFTGDRHWNMDIAINLAERVVDLEEEGLEDLTDAKGDVVPSEWARIYEIDTAPATIDGQRLELVTFKRKIDGNGKHW